MALVSLTFDDGLHSHLDSAIPLLDAYGLNGTFFVDVGSDRFDARFDEWRLAAASGHELGNHSIFHPAVASKAWVTPGNRIEDYNLDRMRQELRVANTVLRILDGRSDRTFAFPCSNPRLGRAGWPRRALTRFGLQQTRLMGWIDQLGWDIADQRVDYTPVVRELFVAARCGGVELPKLPARPLDRHRVRAVEGDGQSAAFFRDALRKAVSEDAWLVLEFHGIGPDHRLYCETDQFADLLRQLVAEPTVQVLSFRDAARRIYGLP